MNQLLTIKNDIIIIDNLAVTSKFNVTGELNVSGESVIHSLNSTTIVTDTLHVKKIITDQASLAPNTEWIANTTDDLNGKGLKWVHNSETTQLIYRSGGRLWNSNSFDIPREASYRIDDIPVLTSTSLGSSIFKSNLKQVGQLSALTVVGDSSISGFAFFNSVSNRLGLGTDEPSSSITIIDNNVEISIGSPVYNLASFGTRSNHDVAIITDDLPRLTVKNSGEVHIGNAISKAGVLRVFGSLYADTIVSDTRLERNTSLDFKATSETTVYGKGLIWTGTGTSKQFIMRDLPDRFWASESIDTSKSYFINNLEVLSETGLGESVINSNLISVGNLTSLSVVGNAAIGSTLTSLEINTTVVKLGDNVSVSNSGISANSSVSLLVNELPILQGTTTQLILGNKESSNIPVTVFGTLSVGVNNPDPTVSLSVNGNVSFNNKKFVNGVSIPTSGLFAKGDICWNDNPINNGYVGWICVQTGTPGEWKPFGLIGV